jgi:hypothetical protein
MQQRLHERDCVCGVLYSTAEFPKTRFPEEGVFREAGIFYVQLSFFWGFVTALGDPKPPIFIFLFALWDQLLRLSVFFFFFLEHVSPFHSYTNRRCVCEGIVFF